MFFSKKLNIEKEKHIRLTRLLDTVNTAVTILLTNNSSASFENTLIKCFGLLGQCLDVDRVQIWRNETINDEQHFILRYEWLSEYGMECKQIPHGLHFPYSMKMEWEKQFLQGMNINAPVKDLSEEDQDFLGYYEIKSILFIPLFLEGDFWGFFSIDDCRNERTFLDEEVGILTSAGLMMSTAVNRNIQITKMREADERTQIMIDAAPLCAIFWDNNMRLIDCNQEAVNLFGLSSKQEFIEKFNQLSPEYQSDGILSTEKGGQLVGKAFDEGYSRFEWTHQKLDGEQIPAEVTCVRVRYKGEFTVTEYIRDLREQKAMMAESRKAEIALESSKAKSEFLAKMSHEIRTPMNAILGITEIQLQDNTLGQVTKDALERIYNSADLLLGIINDILDLSKIEAGKLEINCSQYDIASLIHDTVQINMMRYESKPIEFRLDVDENVPVMLYGDELRIKQILNNLLSNAFKYTQEGMVNLCVSLEPMDESSSDVTMIFSIIDTGQGMTEEQVQKLGSEYSRFNMEANRTTVGTGLGMNITRNLLQLMNSEIHIESSPGMGSKFVVKLPQKCMDYDPLGKELADNLMQLNFSNVTKMRTMQIKRDFMPYGSVLVVDDVETNLYVAKGLMAPYGLSIDLATSGYEAVDKIREGKNYDIIFMDHMMPGMDGMEATQLIRGMDYTKPIIALTANALAGQAEIFMINGFDGFISKPIDVRQLNIALNKFVRDIQPPEVLQDAIKQKDQFVNGIILPALDPQLAEYFIRDAKKATSLLEAIYINKCRRADDLSIFIINIHAMKSALANVNETDLSSEAAKLEQAAREKNINLILMKLPSFMELLYTVIHKFESKESQREESVKTEGDLGVLKEKLLEIKAACMEYNKKTAKNLLTEIKQNNWPQSVKECLSVISENLLHSDFDETVKAIEEYLVQI
ncbi:MAG: ATP-binding protein [Treponema sp.]|nr:ATP-binding protein [Treponema sp.]